MNKLKFFLTQPILNAKAKIWHLLALLVIVNIVPLLLPEELWRDYILFIIAGWVIAYIVLSRTIRTVLRVTNYDAILIERIFVLLIFISSFTYGIIFGARNGFDQLLVASLIFSGGIAAILVLGVVIHLKNAHKYYHGVDKEDLIN